METATLQLPKDLIEAAINQQVQAAMANALGASTRVLDMAVHQVLTSKVDESGNACSYGRTEFIQWAVNDTMKTAIKEALNVEISKYKDRIQEQLISELQKKNSPMLKKLVAGMVDGTVASIADKYRLTINFESN